ncbi:MAG TPA: hypothetical protein PLG99_05615 [Kaistiaceae bacterium]|nr:hypothetical protein [Kaistiaceae bacterium]
MTSVPAAFRDLHTRIEDLDRRLAASQITGDVAAVAGKKVRLKLLDCPVLGKPMLSPWVQVQEQAGGGQGGVSTAAPIRIGETMRLFSPSGEIGPASLAIRDGYTDRSPRPTERDDEYVVAVGPAGEAKLKMREGRVSLERGTQIVELDEENERIRVTFGDKVLAVIRKKRLQLKARLKPTGPADLHVTIDLEAGQIIASPMILGPDPYPED